MYTDYVKQTDCFFTIVNSCFQHLYKWAHLLTYGDVCHLPGYTLGWLLLQPKTSLRKRRIPVTHDLSYMGCKCANLGDFSFVLFLWEELFK